MALEAVVFPQNPFSNYMTNKDLYNLLGGNNNNNSDWCYEGLTSLLDHDHHGQDQSGGGIDNITCPHFGDNYWTTTSPSFDDPHLSGSVQSPGPHPGDQLVGPPVVIARPKRRRARSRKNKEDIENQRMTHIAVERNRRKQMNEYLSVLRSLMPESYVQRGDQASIIGGAINFVKELEQRAQFLGVRNYEKKDDENYSDESSGRATPFSEFFTFPQYSITGGGGGGECQAGVADVEVMMVESHASLKIRSERRPKQLLKVVSGLHSMRLTILHLNVTTEKEIVLYSLSVKVEDDCKLSSVDEIATGVYQILVKVQRGIDVELTGTEPKIVGSNELFERV